MTSAEVLQEILHRMIALKLWDRGGKGYFADYQRVMSGRIEAVYAQDVSLAGDLVAAHPRLSARDLIHLAVMRRLGVTQIVTADRAFDAVPEVQRLDPLDLPSWRAQVLEGA
ncbi:MAG: PIN domain-containing protein [Dehalococcoidia bacterium]